MATGDQASALSYSVRPAVVLKYLGQLALVLAALTCVPLAVSLLAGDHRFTLRFAVAIAALAAAGAGPAHRASPARIQSNEALVISALAFLLAPLVTTYPLMASGVKFADALFEAVSGVTTTGLSTIGSVESQPQTFLFTRAWMQWYGGLGIVVLSLALTMRPGLVARQLSGRPADEEDLVGNTKAHARVVLSVYGALSLAGMAMLVAAGVAPFGALVHTLSAVSTGGFSSSDRSIAALGGWGAQALVILICLSGSVSLTLYHRAARRGWRVAAEDLQLRTILLATVVVTLLLAAVMSYADGMGAAAVARQAPLLAASAQTTAGFSSMDVTRLGGASKLVLMLAMFVGGGVGSTAGGIKALRLLILLQCFYVILRRTNMPRHAVLEPRLGGRRLEDREIRDAVTIIALFVGVIVLSWLPFLAYGSDPLDSLFEVVSATGTVGLSAGVSRPELAPLLKGVLCLDMLAGRLEILAVIVMLYPRTWFGRRAVPS